MGEVAQIVVPQAYARRARCEQCNRASDRQEQDKVQDNAGLQECRWNDERAVADAVDMGRVRHGHGRAVGGVAVRVMRASRKRGRHIPILNSPTKFGTITRLAAP